MKVNELRIGNLVKELVLGIVSVCGIEEDMVWLLDTDDESQYHIEIGNIEPIILTEEWLMKFGFNISGDKNLIAEDTYRRLRLWKQENWIWSIDGGYFRYSVDVIYIHQLQNLYFALTGEELTIKQDAKEIQRAGNE